MKTEKEVKPSDMIEWAMNHPAYLNVGDSVREQHTWLCHFLWNNHDKNGKRYFPDYPQRPGMLEVSGIIGGSMKSRSYLYRYLEFKGDRITPEYRKQALAHWQKLVDDLRKEGR